jgi:hypothetical protein
MRKLKLAVDELAVETFQLQNEAVALGTVRGNETETEPVPEPATPDCYPTLPVWCSIWQGRTCVWNESCPISCVATACPPKQVTETEVGI